MTTQQTSPSQSFSAPSLSHQSGTILLISLVFLTLMSLAGAATLRISTFNQKISGNIIDKQTAQQNAQAALAHAQVFLADLEHDETRIGCTGSNCFPEDDCSNGLCFFGDWTNHENLSSCTADNTAESSSTFFQDKDTWNDSAFSVDAHSKYFIDFRCFSNANGMTQPLYRITAFATGKTDEARTMLQSFYMPTTLATIPAMVSARNNLDFDGSIDIQNPSLLSQMDTVNTPALSYGGTSTVHNTYGDSFTTVPHGHHTPGFSTITPYNLGDASQYFSSFFGVSSVNEISSEFNNTDTILPASFFSYDYENGNKIIIVDGDLSITDADLLPQDAEDVILIINGDLLINGQHSAYDPNDSSPDLNDDPSDFSMIYVGGDITIGAGGQWRHEGVLAVEEDLNFIGSFTLASLSENPAEILSQARNFSMNTTGWSDKNLLF